MNRRILGLLGSFVFVGCGVNAGFKGELSGDGTNTNKPTTPQTPIGSDGKGGCLPDEDFFAQQVSAELLEKDCMTCHIPGGVAGMSRMVFRPTTEDNYLSANLSVLKMAAELKDGEEHLLLLKPTSQVSHQGGARFDVGSTKYRIMEEQLHRFKHPGSCDVTMTPDVCEQAGISVGKAPLRRLTSTQINNTIVDLFNSRVAPPENLPPTKLSVGYSTYLSANVMSLDAVEGLMPAAEQVATAAASDPQLLMGCPQGESYPCPESFVRRFGSRAYRRPLVQGEVDTLLGIYNNSAFTTVQERLSAVVEVVLQSPQFLYLDEARTMPVQGNNKVRQLDSYVIASRLSYLLWDSMPDDRLFSLAEAGQLTTKEAIIKEAERMVESTRARPVVGKFHSEWLGLQRLVGLTKDPDIYPDFNGEMARFMSEEVQRFATHVAYGLDGKFDTLLNSRAAFTNQALDRLYGSSSGSSSNQDWRPTELPNTRSGLLTRAGFLAAYAYAGSSSPIRRGVFVLKALSCEKLEIPNGMMVSLPPEMEGKTIRDRVASHRVDPVCASCHDRIDPVGFSFENYDGMGRWRTQYHDGLPVDASGSLDRPAASFNGAVELSQTLGKNDVIQGCYAQNWFRYAYGREEESHDRCNIRALQQEFVAGGADIKSLLVSLTGMDTFRYVSTEVSPN